MVKRTNKRKLGIDIKCQQLTVNGKIMKDNESLESNNVTYGTEVNLNIIKPSNCLLF